MSIRIFDFKLMPADINRHLRDNYLDYSTRKVCELVSREFREFFKNNHCKIDSKLFCARLASTGNLRILEWARMKLKAPWSPTTCADAAISGHLHVLQWARRNGAPWDAKTCEGAARGGHLEILQWARENGANWTHQVINGAIENNHLPVVRWALANNAPRFNAVGTAAFYGRIEILKLFDDQHQSSPDVCILAARCGHLHVLQWARDTGYALQKIIYVEAADNDHLDVLEWARVSGVEEWDENVCEAAARKGYLHILQWLRVHGAPWNENVCKVAAEKGHLNVLEWARINGAPWNALECLKAADKKGHTDIVNWINRSMAEPHVSVADKPA